MQILACASVIKWCVSIPGSSLRCGFRGHILLYLQSLLTDSCHPSNWRTKLSSKDGRKVGPVHLPLGKVYGPADALNFRQLPTDP